MPKKILFMVPSLGMGGMERMLVNIANALARRGHDVTVINMFFDNPMIVSALMPEVHYYSHCEPRVSWRHFHLSDFGKKRYRLLPFPLWMKFHRAKWLHAQYIKETYDTEIAFYTGYSVKVIAGAPQACKRIFWLHGEAWLMTGMKLGYWTQQLAQKAYLGFHRIVCVSERIEKDFYKRFGAVSNVTTITNLNDVKTIRKLGDIPLAGIEKKRFTFVSAGRIDNENKGFDRILNAVKSLNAIGYTFDVWIIGNGRDFDELMKLKQELQLENVYLLGERENPYQYMKNADVYLCASRYEGYGLVVAEAIILGKPVISTNVSGPSEILDKGKYGLIVENTQDGVYSGMKAILDKPDLIAYLAASAEKRLSFFDEHSIVAKIEAII